MTRNTTPFSSRRIGPIAFGLIACALTSGIAFAASLTGVVTNKTTNKPSAGDDVVLIVLQQGMQEAGRTKTDARGRYTLDLPADSAKGMYLVRVNHDKTPYFKAASPGLSEVDVDVYNTKPIVEGVSAEADVLRVQTDPAGTSLHVVENFFLINNSTPPTTQFSDHAFEFYLPAGAVIASSAAEAQGGMPVQSSPMPLGDPNHYAFVFPIRPGETRFQVTYSLPYHGALILSPHPTLATGAVAIMMPKSMTFKPGNQTPYSLDPEEPSAQTWLARNVQPSQPMSFTISGTGQLPRDTPVQDANSGGTSGNSGQAAGNDLTPDQASAQMRADTQGGKGLGNPLDSSGELDAWHRYKYWTIGVFGLLLALAAFIMLRTSTPPTDPSGAPLPRTATDPTPPVPSTLLNILRDELFAAETDRLQGRLSDAQYTELKSSIDIVLRRALARTGAAEPKTPEPDTSQGDLDQA